MPYKNIDQRRAYGRTWAKKKNAAYKRTAVDMLGGCCIRCKQADIRVLQFDHIVPILRQKWGDSGTYLAREIATGRLDKSLFQVLCANCHMIKSYYEE